MHRAYHGDGKRTKLVDNYGTVIYIGPQYERNVGNGQDTSNVVTKLYWAQLGPYRRLIAVRRTVVGVGETLYYLHHDHLGSTKAESGGLFKYYPFGWAYQEVSNPPTDNLYTGQTLDMSTGLYDYGARYYDVAQLRDQIQVCRYDARYATARMIPAIRSYSLSKK